MRTPETPGRGCVWQVAIRSRDLECGITHQSNDFGHTDSCRFDAVEILHFEGSGGADAGEVPPVGAGGRNHRQDVDRLEPGIPQVAARHDGPGTAKMGAVQRAPGVADPADGVAPPSC